MIEINRVESKDKLKTEFGRLFVYQRLLGAGGFGKVVLAFCKKTKEEVAVKIISKSRYSQNNLDKLQKEIQMIQQLQHENIVKFKDFHETSSFVFIVMEYVRGGTLKTLLKSLEFASFTEDKIATLLYNILKAIEHLHKHEIIHRDIKMENVLLGNPADLTSVKICDFGLSSQNFEFENDLDYSGTLTYMAPEQLNKRAISKSIDIWSFGVIAYLLLSKGKHPYYSKGDTITKLKNEVKQVKVNFDITCSSMAKQFIGKLLKVKVADRLNASSCLAHPFITRRYYDPLPLTYLESIQKRNSEQEAKKLLCALMFLSMMRNKRTSKNYEKLTEDVANVSSKFYYEKRENEFIPGFESRPGLLLERIRKLRKTSSTKLGTVGEQKLETLLKKTSRKKVENEVKQVEKLKTLKNSASSKVMLVKTKRTISRRETFKISGFLSR